MTWEITFTDGPFSVVIKTAGVATIEGFRAMRDDVLADPRFRHGVNVMFDHSDLDPSRATASTVREIADYAARSVAFSSGYTAFVMPSPELYGLGRMWEAFVPEEMIARTRLVRSVDEAYAWLESVTPDQA